MAPDSCFQQRLTTSPEWTAMSLFPTEMESERLRYERLHPEEVDPFELYEHARTEAPDIEEITEYVTWDPYEHPKEAFDWVERCGTRFEDGDAATYVLRTKAGDHASLSTYQGEPSGRLETAKNKR